MEIRELPSSLCLICQNDVDAKSSDNEMCILHEVMILNLNKLDILRVKLTKKMLTRVTET